MSFHYVKAFVPPPSKGILYLWIIAVTFISAAFSFNEASFTRASLLSSKLVSYCNFPQGAAFRSFGDRPFYEQFTRSYIKKQPCPLLSVTACSSEPNCLPAVKADVIVIGGGHSGCEAAGAAARMGAFTLLITQRKDTIGEMSCNPSIGGIGKGHLVREIDALDGLMGRVIDQSAIHFRVLNRKKGLAVRGIRAQADRDIYKQTIYKELCKLPNLKVIEASIESLLLEDSFEETEQAEDLPLQLPFRKKMKGVWTSRGELYLANRIVLTTGTFLRGRCWQGNNVTSAGRFMRNSSSFEPAAEQLAMQLKKLNFPLGRLKTGTPPRLDGRTIDWRRLTPQNSENPPTYFSFLSHHLGNKDEKELICCYKTYTNAETHRIVAKNCHTLPALESGTGRGVGPRYCPSLPSKIERFPDKDRHIIWLEPEGLVSNVIFPNGLSGGFPVDIQERIIHSIEGLEQCEILRPGYDVEYDFVDPRCLYPTLETRQIEGLFFAGQICGTTGYEEAAAMGIVAGINAALNRESTPRDESLKNLPSSFIVHRDEAYMGVLIDDLVTKGTNEPYRMFTSRAEHRLTLRNDNADIRLTRRGHVLGVVSPQRYSALEQREKKIQWSLERLRKFKLPLYKWVQCGLLNSTDFERSLQHTRQRSAAEILFMPNISLFILEKCVEDVAKTEEKGCDEKQIFNFTEPHVAETVEAECKYSKYIQRQKRELQRWQKSMHLLIPSDINYSREIFPSFSAEALQKLAAQRPRSISEAARISGINSQSLFDLYSYIAKTNS